MEKRRKISLLIGQGLILLFFVVLAAGSASSHDVAGGMASLGSGYTEAKNMKAKGYVQIGVVSDASTCLELCRNKGYDDWWYSSNYLWCYCK